MLVRALAVAVCAVLPLVAGSVWTGFRLALALVWFGLAYWQRRLEPWEVVMVVVGGAIALARLGNAWFYALAMVPPLARQLAIARLDTRVLSAAAIVSLATAVFIVYTTRPPALPSAAETAAVNATASGEVFGDWRWAGELERQLGQRVVPENGFASENADFWSSYVRIMQGHEHWLQDLQGLDANVVVVDSAD